MKKKFTSRFFLSFLVVFFTSQLLAQPNVTLTTSPISAANVPQGSSNHIVYAVQMAVSNQAVTVNSLQVTLSGTHDNSDLNTLRVYFNSSAPTISGAVHLNAVSAAFAAPRTYNVSVTRAMAANTSGYFLVTVDVSPTATHNNTIKVDGAANPVIFGYSTGVVLTNNQTDLAGLQTVQAADVVVSSSPVPAANIQQGASNQIVYIAKMDVASQPVTVNQLQVTLTGTHDANDLNTLRVYFNASSPSLTGAVHLNAISAAFAAPHTYNVSITRAMAAGSSGYFIVTIDFSATATHNNTVKVNGAVNPVVFGFTTAPNLTNSQTDVAGLQTIQAADVTISSSAVAPANIFLASSNNIVYVAHMSVATQPVTVNAVQVTLTGTHDNNDLTTLRVYFNPSAPAISGSVQLNAVSATFAAPHTYNVSITRAMAAGSSGYFIFTVDVNASATDGNTVKVDGAANPVVFGFTTAPNVTNNQSDAAGTQTIEAADVAISTAPVPAANLQQGSSNNIIYVAQMNVTSVSVVVNSIQVTLSGTHDNNDLNTLRVYFNASQPNLSGAVHLNAISAAFAAPHNYTVSVTRTMNAGSSGYFIFTVDVNASGTHNNTIKVDGGTNPVVFGFTTAPNVTNSQTDLAGTQTIQAADVTIASVPVNAKTLSRGSSNNIVYVAQVNVSNQPVTVNNVQVVLTGTHDMDDLTTLRIYFNPSQPTLTGAVHLDASSAAFPAPHTYSVSVTRMIAAGGSGYFLVTVDVSASATIGNSIKVDGSANPLTLGYTTAPNVTNNQTDAAGTQTISSILPVELRAFTAKLVQETVHLQWTTATERQNSHFIVEHSADGQTFHEIGKVAGNGTTTVEHHYQFTHTAPQKGRNFYRLKQVDQNHQSKYSGIVLVSFDKSKELIVRIFGNPAGNRLTLSVVSPVSQKLAIQLADQTGRGILRNIQRVVEGDNVLTLELNRYANGVYFLQLTDEKGRSHTQKLLLGK